MKLIMIYAGIHGYEQKLNIVSKIITDTLSEFDDCEIETVTLSKLPLSFYNGKNASEINQIAEKIKAAKGVIFAASASMFSLNAAMVQFLEYMQDVRYQQILADKNCLITVTSETGGERAASDQLSQAIASLSGFDAGRIMIGRAYLTGIETNADLKEMVERQIEDYYRVIRQNRKFFIPATPATQNIDKVTAPTAKQPLEIPPFSQNELKELFSEARVKRFKTEDLFEKYSLGALDEQQEQEISEITKLFAQKYTKDESAEKLVAKGEKPLDMNYADPRPREKTCLQITASLPHYFRPQLANDFNAVFQLIISAKNPNDSFEGYLTINGATGVCTFNEGQSEQKDITIMGDEAAWMDVIKGKHSAQKAFMIGQLKVRGNFLFLSKLDAIFNFSMAAG
ncbi:MAG: SCP2 sterol-binding domain-containing protein [Clostridiales bacterium]|jgi:putative sterol carrier protein/NAD(P)H-dependent FMN reductase|nr:SCP2 sterol-binding domain-containing protein [Clostridiales bacterium]